MSNIREGQNTHDAGRFRKDWHTDASMDETIRDLEASKGDGVSGDEMDTLLKSGADYGQVTEREFSAMKQWVGANWDRMSPEAQEKWTKFDKGLQEVGGKGTANKHHGHDEAIIMKGAQLESLMKDVGETGKKAPPQAPTGTDGCEPPAPTSAAPPASKPPAPEPSKPPAEPSPSGSSFAGMSWQAIFAMILDKLDKLENKLKLEAQAAAGEIEKTAKEQESQAAGGTPGAGETSGSGGTSGGGGTGETKAGGAPGDSSQSARTKLALIQGDIQKLNEMFSMVSNLMQAIHDTNKVAIGNLRV